MAKAQEAVENIEKFLDDQFSLEEFEDWSASFAQTVFQSDDAKAQELALLVRSRLNAFEDDESDAGLRQELAVAIYPFVHIAANQFGAPSSVAESNANFDFNVAA
jgi:hypothetical protein